MDSTTQPTESTEPLSIRVTGFLLQAQPKIFVAKIPGSWLLKHTRPSLRIEDPKRGFQRIVNQERAEKIATSVLDQRRTFPNAIILATDATDFEMNDGQIELMNSAKFLVVDGQHRLWAQTYSSFQAEFGCFLHMNLSDREMATLFLEINENQKKVPASLRWDLYRLVQPEDQQDEVAASELVLELTTNKTSPLFQRIDLTGEQPEITIKQASVAPEIRTIIATRGSPLNDLDFDSQYETLTRYLAAIKSRDSKGWRKSDSPLYNNRVLRALIKLLPEIIQDTEKDATKVTARDYKEYLNDLDLRTLDLRTIRSAQGSAGISMITDVIRRQILSS